MFTQYAGLDNECSSLLIKFVSRGFFIFQKPHVMNINSKSDIRFGASKYTYKYKYKYKLADSTLSVNKVVHLNCAFDQTPENIQTMFCTHLLTYTCSRHKSRQHFCQPSVSSICPKLQRRMINFNEWNETLSSSNFHLNSFVFIQFFHFSMTLSAIIYGSFLAVFTYSFIYWSDFHYSVSHLREYMFVASFLFLPHFPFWLYRLFAFSIWLEYESNFLNCICDSDSDSVCVCINLCVSFHFFMTVNFL